MASFKVGDVVMLRSGGPKMTIERYPYEDYVGSHSDRAYCSWFSDNELKHEVFRIDALESFE